MVYHDVFLYSYFFVDESGPNGKKSETRIIVMKLKLYYMVYYESVMDCCESEMNL